MANRPLCQPVMKVTLSYCCCSCCHSDGNGTVTCGEPHLFHRPPSRQIMRADDTSVFLSFNAEMMKIRNGRRRPGLPSAQMCHDDTSTQGSNPTRRAQRITAATPPGWGIRGHEGWHKLQLAHWFGASHDSLKQFKVHWHPEGSSYSQFQEFWEFLEGCW